MCAAAAAFEARSVFASLSQWSRDHLEDVLRSLLKSPDSSIRRRGF